jgi:putative endonuclease
MFFLYILQSLNDKWAYVGVTNNLQRRLDEHNKGYVRSTKNKRPFALAHKEGFFVLSEARKREWFLKCTPQGGKEKRNILNMAGMAARRA